MPWRVWPALSQAVSLIFIERIDFLRGEAMCFGLAQLVDAEKCHTVQVGAHLETHAAVADRIAFEEDVAKDELPLILALGVLLQLRVFNREFSELAFELANIELSVAAMNGAQRELARDDDGSGRFLGCRCDCHDASP